MARAGYSPQAYVDILDRLQGTHGKTGSWFSDFFGTTKPSQRRLREVMKNMAVLPPGCAETRASSDEGGFQQWRANVIASRKISLEETLPGLVFKQPLALPLRPDINNLHFSPDGKYVLAQDDGGIHVLSRDPLTPLFFIDAPDAHKAVFSPGPDSRSVVFYTSSLRVETWDIATHQRTSVHEVLLKQPCLQAMLSPDGRFLGCLKFDFSLSLLDVPSGETLVAKQNFLVVRSYFGWFLLLEILAKGNVDLIHMGFSPDGRYFLAGCRSSTLAYDLTLRREAGLPGSIRSVTQENFAFAGPDRIIGVNPYSADKSPVLRFPSGERIGELPLSNTTHVASAAHGDYVLLWPLKDNPLGVMDLNKRELFISFKHDAGDIYDNWVLSERADGELAISDIRTKQLLGAVHLNQSRLGALKAVAVSPDFNRLALATRTRGAGWDLAHNIRIFLSRSFQGGWFAEDGSLYADFPEFENDAQSIVRLDVFGQPSSLYSVQKGLAHQAGPHLIIYQPAHENGLERKDCTVEVRDLRTQRTLWSRHFSREVPEISLQSPNSLLLGWPVSDGAARDELQNFPAIRNKAEREDYLFEVLDLSKDSITARLLVKTNKASFRVLGAATDGDWAVVSVSSDRVLVYSLSSGEEKGHAFGTRPSLSAVAGLFAVSTASGELNLYDLPSSELRRQYGFPVPVSYQQFSRDGKRLFVLTRDQTAYVLDLTAPSSP